METWRVANWDLMTCAAAAKHEYISKLAALLLSITSLVHLFQLNS